MGLGAVSSTAFDTQPPDLPPVMEWIRVSQSFARSPATVGLLSGSCSSARAFAPRFFQAPPRGECYFTLALRYDFTSIRLSKGLSPSSCRTCSAHSKKGHQSWWPRLKAIQLSGFAIPECFDLVMRLQHVHLLSHERFTHNGAYPVFSESLLICFFGSVFPLLRRLKQSVIPAAEFYFYVSPKSMNRAA